MTDLKEDRKNAEKFLKENCTYIWEHISERERELMVSGYVQGFLQGEINQIRRRILETSK